LLEGCHRGGRCSCPSVASCSGLSVDTELACHSTIVSFTTCMLATTIDTIFTEFLGTYRSKLL
jgi:hypothetical protein